MQAAGCTRPLFAWGAPLIACSLLWCLGSAAAEESPVRLTVAVDRTEVVIGEPIHYRITLEHPLEVAVTPPSALGTSDDVTIEEHGTEPSRIEAGTVTSEAWYRLSIYATGTHTIPAPVATYSGADGSPRDVRGQPVTITVQSLLPEDWESQDIRDVKPLVRLRRNGWLWAIAAVVLLGRAAAAVWWRRHRTPLEVAGPPPRPAHELALEALDRLRRDALPSRDRFEEYYVRLSQIARTYVEGRFGLRAPEMTTEEFLYAAAQAAVLGAEHRQMLQAFLTRCDLVKFAKYQPSTAEADEGFESARRFGQETVPSPEPVPVSRG